MWAHGWPCTQRLALPAAFGPCAVVIFAPSPSGSSWLLLLISLLREYEYKIYLICTDPTTLGTSWGPSWMNCPSVVFPGCVTLCPCESRCSCRQWALQASLTSASLCQQHGTRQPWSNCSSVPGQGPCGLPQALWIHLCESWTRGQGWMWPAVGPLPSGLPACLGLSPFEEHSGSSRRLCSFPSLPV